MTIKRIKNICLALCLTLLLGAVSVVPAQAVGLSVSVGQSRVSVGNEFSVTVRVSDDVAAWTYQITYSSNLTLVSGNTMPDGFAEAGSPRINTLLFRANSQGTGTITASCTKGLSDGSQDYSSSDSASITIVSASTDDGGEPPYHGGGSSGGSSGTTSPSKSSNNALSTLTVSAGELTPAFDPAVTEYSLFLPLDTEKLTVTAEPSDSKATVQGAGEVTLQGGENKVAVVVTAEDGSTKTYNLTVKVAQRPTVFFPYGDGELGVIKDVEAVTAPEGFTATTVTHGSDTLPAWINSAKQILLYLVDENSVPGFYLYSGTQGVLSPYLPLTGGYIYTGVPQEQQTVSGLVYGQVEAFGHTLNGWTYRQDSLQEFCVLYLMDSDGVYGYYTYDTVQKTLQRFNGAVRTDGQGVEIPQLVLYAACGVLLVLVIILACVSGSRGKKLRRLSADLQSQPVSPEEPSTDAEKDSAEPAAEISPQEEPAPEPVFSEELPEAAPQEEPEEQPAPEGALLEDPLPQEEPSAPMEPAQPQPDSTPEEPAQPEEAVADATENSVQPSLEDTLRHLPLDDLLRDIHDL